MSRGRSFVAALVLVLAVVATPAAAQSVSADKAADFIRDLGNRAIEILAKPNLEKSELEEEFHEMFREAFHIPSISRFVLGRYWRAATPEQREKFKRLFENFVVETYSARFLAAYSGQKFNVKDVRKIGDREAVVVSEIVDPNGPPVRANWRIGVVNGEHKILDVVVEGVSMAVTQRSEFASIIQRSGGRLEGLLSALREKTKSLTSEAERK